MPRLIWSPRALRDIRRLYDFLEPKNLDAARRAALTIRNAARALARHPEIGRPVDDMPDEFRELVIEFGQSAYVAWYRYDGKQVMILAIRHGREAGF